MTVIAPSISTTSQTHLHASAPHPLMVLMSIPGSGDTIASQYSLSTLPTPPPLHSANKLASPPHHFASPSTFIGPRSSTTCEKPPATCTQKPELVPGTENARRACTGPFTPPPKLRHAPAEKTAMFSTAAPPATLKLPPAYSISPTTARASTSPSSPHTPGLLRRQRGSRRGVHPPPPSPLPSHLATLSTSSCPALLNLPPTKRRP
mmetsp:Transcript_24435/g.55082  ORF Transcript_24435/g.55082 Transcript_24435/m.55082 type:complete len:206 (+) Transcript_24435:1150-1767(+)